MSDYDKLLKQALEQVPESSKKSDSRFEIPKVKGHIQGNKTIITNFQAITQTLRRDQEHLLKYLLRELAAPGEISGPRLILNRKMASNMINEKIEKYAKEFVICKECGKPDTKVMKEGRIQTLKCTACGAKHPINAKV
jgi:translation initiation factor 2 subunit 2